ncbi:methyl-accepting chemotaxis protein, partial [Wenzhouxiangella sp. XN24]|nr:methyl-accepting chemotaxis protein [Wenzhouxiangella sp. XN24]
AAASSLEDQAHGLAQAVSVFRIDDAKLSGIAAPRSTPAKAPAPKASAAKSHGAAPKRAEPAEAGEEWAEF